VKELRAAKDKDAAARIKALRKPTAAAWALNQLSRKNAKALDELLELGERLRKAQRAALSGRGASDLRELSNKRRKAIDGLTKKAAAHLGPGGDAQREAIAQSLEAAVASEEAADELAAGQLVKPIDPPSGFGDVVPGLSLVAGSEGDEDPGSSARDRRRAARAERRGAQPDGNADAAADDEREARQRELEALLAEKQAALEKARSDAQTAAREAAAARAEVSRLQDELVSANGRAKAATERARVAQWAQSQAQQELDTAGRKLDAL